MPSTGPQPFPGQEKRLRLLAFVRQDSVVRVDKRVEDTAMVWPHLLVIEFIVAMLWLVALPVVSPPFTPLPISPYLGQSREGVGLCFPNRTRFRVFLFSAVFTTVLTFALIFID